MLRQKFMTLAVGLAVGLAPAILAPVEADAASISTAVAQQSTLPDARWTVTTAARLTKVQAAQAQSLIKAINNARTKARTCGGKKLPSTRPVRSDNRLAASSRSWASHLATHNWWSHYDAKGRSPRHRITSQGVRSTHVGEVINGGSATAAAAVARLLKSPSHCKAIMSPKFKIAGGGMAAGTTKSRFSTYWVVTFAA